MLFPEFAALVRFYTHTDEDTFEDEDILLLANVQKDEIAKDINGVNEGYFGMPAYRDLEAGVREYGLPADLLSSIERVEVSLDGTKYLPISEMDLSLTHMATDETSVLNYFAGKDPGYDLFRGSIFIYSGDPITDVPNGIKLWAILYPSKFDNLTDVRDMAVPKDSLSSGFPRQFHELLARRVSIAYKQGQDEPIALNEHEKQFDDDLQKALVSVRSANFDRSIGATEKTDNGFDY